MPLYSFDCPNHGSFTRLLKNREKECPCPTCNSLSKNIYKTGTVRVMERLDNGLMARAVERLVDIEEINQADAEKDTERFNERNGRNVDEDQS